jgi:NADH-quinone oxidoreductase subunit L
MRKLQNGYVRSYALSMFGGALVLVATTLLMRMA